MNKINMVPASRGLSVEHIVEGKLEIGKESLIKSRTKSSSRVTQPRLWEN